MNSNCIDDATPFLETMKFNVPLPKENLNRPQIVVDEDELEETITQLETTRNIQPNSIAHFVSNFNPHDPVQDGIVPNDTGNLQSDLDPDDPLQDGTAIPTFKNSPILENGLAYISGYISQKILKNHDCESCRDQLAEVRDNTYEANYYFYNIFLKEKECGPIAKLFHPNRVIIDKINKMEQIFVANIKQLTPSISVRFKLKTIVLNECNRLPLQLCDGIYEKIIDVFLQMRLHYNAKFINKALKGKRKRNEPSTNYVAKKKNKKMSNLTHM